MPSGATAQDAAAAAVLRVTVTDDTARPLAGVEVSAVRGLQDVLARRTTDAAGRAVLVVPPDGAAAEAVEVVGRLIGYWRTSKFLGLMPGDTADVQLVLRPVPRLLDAVRVDARRSTRERHYRLDADAIAASDRPIRSALDAIAALRPRMFTSLAGWRVCGTMQHVWVNGRRASLLVHERQALAWRPLPGVHPKHPVPLSVLTVLDEIRPEHVAEINYTDCFDRLGLALSENSVFIVLKAGVEYVPGRGTRVRTGVP